jgi:uncharacterized membrane protein YphA (DoxX/SURF4 family)
MPRMNRLDLIFLRWQRHARSRALLYRFTLATRVLLAVGFIPTGMVKVLGWRFTTMSPAYPIGAFFETLYQSGPYWRFIGLAQVLAGICVLVPAAATLGAVLFFPIMLNIFVITLSYDFHLTPVITGLMLLANLYLLCWDYDRLRPILGAAPFATQSHAPLPDHRLGSAERAVYLVGSASALCFMLSVRLGLFFRSWSLWLLAIGTTSAFVALGFAWVYRFGSPIADRRGTADAHHEYVQPFTGQGR